VIVRDIWGDPIERREMGYAKGVLTVGGEAGLWVSAFGGPQRIAVRVDRVHGETFSVSRLAIGVARHW
jgi:hypothetical protein